MRQIFEGMAAVLCITLVGWCCDAFVTAFSVFVGTEVEDGRAQVALRGETDRPPRKALISFGDAGPERLGLCGGNESFFQRQEKARFLYFSRPWMAA